jgi:hypothetical protein
MTAEAQTDLSFNHEMLTGLFARPTEPAEWKSYQLSAQQVQAFRDDGYVAPVRVSMTHRLKRCEQSSPR